MLNLDITSERPRKEVEKEFEELLPVNTFFYFIKVCDIHFFYFRERI